MARLVVLDTETTGLYARNGDRVVEIGCIEILDRRITENRFHVYLNPERASDEGAERVKAAYPGATWDRLRKIKKQYDPQNLFRLNKNIPPAA